jgi:hypothetical protein
MGKGAEVNANVQKRIDESKDAVTISVSRPSRRYDGSDIA